MCDFSNVCAGCDAMQAVSWVVPCKGLCVAYCIVIEAHILMSGRQLLRDIKINKRTQHNHNKEHMRAIVSIFTRISVRSIDRKSGRICMACDELEVFFSVCGSVCILRWAFCNRSLIARARPQSPLVPIVRTFARAPLRTRTIPLNMHKINNQ